MPATTQDDPLASMPNTLASAPAARTGPVPDYKRLGSQSGEQIVQQETGIHPFKSPVAQAVAGPVRAVWGVIRSPYDLLRAAYAAPQTPEEEGALAGGGHVGLLLDKMLLHPAVAAHKTGTELREKAQTTRAAAQKIENAANNPQQLKALQRLYPQYDLSTPEKAHKVASGINRTAITNFAMSLPAELGALPMVGSMGQQTGARMAAGDVTGAVTESLANALMTGAPETVGKVIPHEFITRTIPKETVGHLIKPMKGDLTFGKEPAAAILDEGLTSWTLDGLGDKVSDRLQSVGKQIDDLARSPKYAGRRVDMSGSLKPLDDAMAKAVKDGDGPLYNSLRDTRNSLYFDWQEHTLPTGKTVIRPVGPRNMNMSPYEALQFKRMIGDRVRWTNDPLQGAVNQKLGTSYVNAKDALNTALPKEFRDLNERYSNLVGAAKAIQRRIPVAQRNAHWSLSDIALGTHSIPMAVARKVGMLPIVRTAVPGAMYRLPKPTALVGAAPVISGAGQAARQGTPSKTAAKKGAVAAPSTTDDPLVSMPDTLSQANIISDAATAHGVNPNLIRAVIGQESGDKPGAVSIKGATGLMQLMPDTAQRYGVTDATDPIQNVMGGTSYLRDLLDKHNGDVTEALKDYYGRGTPPPGYPSTDEYAQAVLKRFTALDQPPPAHVSELKTEAAKRKPSPVVAKAAPPTRTRDYAYTAHKGDHVIGTDDGKRWFDVQTGQQVQ